MSAPAQHVVLASENLTQKQEDFARYYIEYRNASTAYRMAYDVSVDTLPSTVWQEASRVLAHPSVSARVDELRKAAEAVTICVVRDMVTDLHDVATHDATEISQVATYNCRHCYGAAGRYQWRDEDELMDATQAAQDQIDQGVKRVKFPDVRGGFGFVVRRPPNPDCVKCMGAGVVVTRFADSAQLTGKARKAYKGVKQTNSGVEVMTHDKMGAINEMLKVLGAYGKDVTLNPAAAAQPVPLDATEAEAAQAYQRMIGQS